MTKNLPFPDGPKGSFFLGNLSEFNRDQLGYLEMCARDYGDIVRLRFFNMPAYILNHPDHIKYVLVTNSRNFVKPMAFRLPIMRGLFGNGLLTSEGDEWLQQRRLAQPAFHHQRILSYGKVMVDYTDRRIDSWRDGQTLDLHEELLQLTSEIVTKTLFDANIDGADVLFEPLTSQATLKWYMDNYLPTAGNRRFKRSLRQLDEIIYGIIRQRRANGPDGEDLLSTLMRAEDEDGNRMSERQLRDQAVTLFLAGHDTTTLALSWAIYLLAQDPAATAVLEEELDRVLDGRLPTAEDLPALSYTAAVIQESMRLYPPIWGTARETVEECEIGGYRVPKRTQIYMFQWVVHRDGRFFERPTEFHPERWLEESIKDLPKFAYFPFGGGPRLCMGHGFAKMEATLILATIFQKYRFSLVPGHEVRPLLTFSLQPEGGIKVILERKPHHHLQEAAS